MGGVMGSRTGGGSRSETPRLVWAGAYAAILGAALIVVGAVWLAVSGAPDAPGGPGVGARLMGLAGIALTTMGLLGLYALLVEVGSPVGITWGIAGAMISVLSVVSVAWIAAQPGALSGPGGIGEGATLLAFAMLIVVWIRPVGIMIFGVAAMVADFRGPWEYVLFAIGMLETPLPALALLRLIGPDATPGWTFLLFGMPGDQSGILAALAWVVFGGALLASGHDLLRRRRNRNPTY